MQFINRHCTGKLLDFSSLDDIISGCISLRNDNDNSFDPSTSVKYAMEFLRQTMTILPPHKCLSIAYWFPSQPFSAPSLLNRPHKWYGSRIRPLTGSTLHQPPASLVEQAHNVAQNANFAILAGHHYWVYPKLASESGQLHSATLDLATTR